MILHLKNFENIGMALITRYIMEPPTEGLAS